MSIEPKINNSTAKPGEKCACGHPAAAHGSGGKICGACACKQYVKAAA